MIKERYAQIEKIAIWKPVSPILNVRSYGSFPYMQNGIYRQATPTDRVYRYVKDFSKDGVDFSLVVFSKESDRSTIEKRFSDAVSSITKQQVLLSLSNATMNNLDYIEES